MTGAMFRTAVVVGVAFAAYHNSFPGVFVFDDFSSVVENSSIRQLWPPADVFAPSVAAGVAGRPIANLSFALNFAISGSSGWSYHALNLLIHALTGVLLCGLVRRTLQLPTQGRTADAAAPLALSIAVLWVVHPLQTSVVDYVSQRTEGLMALCYLVTLYAFIRGLGRGSMRWRILSVAACGLGMGCKETMVTAPLLVALYDRTFVGDTVGTAWRERRGYYFALASTWLVLGGLIAASDLNARGVGFGLGVSWTDYVLTQCRAVLLYLRLAIWPAPLVFDYGWAFSTNVAEAIPFIVGCAALVSVSAFVFWRRPVWGFGAVWFLLTLAPTSSIVPIVQQPLAESRMYLPLAGIIGTVVVGTWTLLRSRPVAAGVLFVVVAVMLTGNTVRRNRDYRSEIDLWSDTIAKQPENARAHGNLGAALLRAGRVQDAIVASSIALKLRPDYPEARSNLGAALNQSGRFAEAIEQFKAALRARPESVEARYNLGEALAQTGQTNEAIATFEAVLRQDPTHARAHNNLGVVLLQIGRSDEAIAHDRTALRFDPGFAEAHYNLGNALAGKGDTAAAITAYESALRERPDFPRAHNNLGAVLLRAGRAAEAIAHFEAAMRLKPDYEEARRNLAIARGR